jgi:hypothetical protein
MGISFPMVLTYSVLSPKPESIKFAKKESSWQDRREETRRFL